MLTLIDADSILFKACCTQDSKSGVKKTIKETFMKIDQDCMMQSVQIALKGKGNFRYKVYSDYKSNRPDLDQKLKDKLNYAYEWVMDNYPATSADGMEADDLVSIWSWEALNSDRPYVVAHIDKDLDQIPGIHYNYNKGERYEVSAVDAYIKLIQQWITGDSADGIPGLPGYGPAKAKKLLEETQTLETLLEDYQNPEINLTHHQRLGLKYYHELEHRIPYKEIQSIEKYLAKTLKHIDSQLGFHICGSFRRKAKDSGDIDVLLYHNKIVKESDIKHMENYLQKFTTYLHQTSSLNKHIKGN